MEELLNHLKTRIAILEQAIKRAEKDAGSFPCGHLRVSASRNRCRYYQLNEDGDLVDRESDKVLLHGRDTILDKSMGETEFEDRTITQWTIIYAISKVLKSRRYTIDWDNVFEEEAEEE